MSTKRIFKYQYIVENYRNFDVILIHFYILHKTSPNTFYKTVVMTKSSNYQIQF